MGRHQADPPAPGRGRDASSTCSWTRRASRRASRTPTSRLSSSSASTRTPTGSRWSTSTASRCARSCAAPRRWGSPMPPEIACRVIADAAEGLHAAHELLGRNGEKLNLIHRDVTPHNLFVTYDGTTKVVDFGIAKFSSRMASTRAGTLKGKLAYMSPEQVGGRAHRPTHRRLRARRRALGADDRAAPVPDGERSRHAGEGPGVQRPAPQHHRARLPDRPREDRDEGAREEQERALPDRARVLAGAAVAAHAPRPVHRERRGRRRTWRRSSPTASPSARRTCAGRAPSATLPPLRPLQPRRPPPPHPRPRVRAVASPPSQRRPRGRPRRCPPLPRCRLVGRPVPLQERPRRHAPLRRRPEQR